MPPAAAGLVSGWDMRGIRLYHDPITDVLYVGLDTFGIAGDADGDGAEGGTSAWLAASLGLDLPQFAETESAAVLFDFDGDGLFDVIAGVPGDGALGDFTVAEFAGVPSAPAFAFGAVLVEQTMGAYTSGPTSASSPHLEFAIPRFSEMPGFTGAFHVQAFMGSFADAGIGDDRVPNSGGALACLDADQDGYTTCDGDCNDRSALANPGALGDPFCDGVDDDCDGETDEDFGGLGVPTQCGNDPICQAQGMALCLDGKVVDSCVPGNNGQFTPEATSCGVGACAATGTTTCATGDVTDTCTPGTPAASDPCNGVDDDCDGITDEDFVSTATSCGVGICERNGATQCVAGVVVNSCVAGPPAATETCDGRDEDCDGLTDEEAVLPPAPVCGQGSCAKVGTIQCISGTIVETCQPGNAETEICDGVDNDCDGEVDEDPKMADPETCGQGACGVVGTVECVDGEEIATCEPGAPTAELCDGLDNDCDGVTDEDIQLPAPPTCGIGACHTTGTVSCVDGQLVEVCHALRGTAELCDLIDNDCDGKTDEDAELPPAPNCGVGACAAIGTSQCLRGQIVTSCVPGRAKAEICDALDNDCDGETDEDPALPAATDCGQGACAATGSVSCEAGQVVETCEPGTPGVEACNGIDDDCDGQVDEDVVLPAPPTCGEGSCAATGTVACVGGEIVESCEAGTSGVETCNGVDDDCDGQIDEDVVLTGAPTCGEGACAATGTVSCVGGKVVESCTPGAASAELCNGIDDDCDGVTDEEVSLPAAPTCGEGACAATGTVACIGGEIVESCEPGGNRPEACNGVDDDCDGQTDEDVNLGEAPKCGLGACATTGTIACIGGEIVGSCEPTGSRPEACNGVDDDCDGETDEDVVLPAAPTCGEGACAVTGTIACIGGEIVESCEADGARPEACNGVDDDCDGETDEDVVLPAAPTCGEGVCAATGTVACVGGKIVESCEPGKSQNKDKNCDGLDNDCDGQTDEGFQGSSTECGVGACHGRGQTSCVDGKVVDSCRAGEPADSDATCDDNDDDCDGEIDEDCGTCGDGVVQDGEACDDGNNAFFDGCTPTCDIEQCPLVIDFEVDALGQPILAGEDLSMAWIDAGISMEAYTKADMSVGTLPLAFNSAAPTGDDFDLGTPNKAFGGPGVGTGGKTTNKLGRGIVAIIAENLVDANKDGLIDSPDDNAKGGALVFEFDYNVCIDSVGILDNDSGETITIRAYSADGMLLSTRKASALGDNSYEYVGIDTCGVRRLVATLTGSGAVTNITYCPDHTEVCDGIDNDGDLEIDEEDACGCPVPDPGRTYLVSAAHSDECGGGNSTHAVHIPGFFDGNKDHVVRFTFNDDARFEWDGSGATARFFGTAKVYSLGGGKGDLGSEWFVDVSLDYRGQGIYGQGYGGPKKEMAGCQPKDITDTWDYFGFAANKAHMWRVSNPLDIATLTMYPVDAQFPVQVGMAANGKNAGLGLSTWFSFKHNAPNKKCITGYGDFNVDLDCP
ncbi:MAG: MopE-related protein [Myxococcota bacterium]